MKWSPKDGRWDLRRWDLRRWDLRRWDLRWRGGTHLDLLHVGYPGAGFGQGLLKGGDVGQQSRDVLCLLNDGGQSGRGVFLPVGRRGGGEEVSGVS